MLRAQSHDPSGHLRRRSLLRLGLAAALRPMAAHGQQDALSLMEVEDGNFVHFGQISLTTLENRGDIANLGVIVGEAAVAVVDTGGSIAVGQALREAIRNITAKPIRYVINTHEHPDHVFGNAAFEGDAVFVGHHNLPAELAQRGPYYLQSYRDQLGAEAIEQVRLIPPALLVNDALVLDLGGRRIRLVAWGTAHTNCDLTVLDETSGLLFAGDLVFLQHIPVVDGSLKGWLAILPELSDVPAGQVLPGHGRLVAPWPQATADERRYLGTLAADTRRLIAAGAPMQQALAIIGDSERGRWQLFDEYNRRNATAAFSELEWE